MQLYDTLRGKKATLEIPPDRPLTLYVCGVTPYDTTHLGHAHTFLIFDALIRYIRFRGGQVRYCQNVTDVDDPLFERARRDGIGWRELAQREVEQFVKDQRELNMIAPDFFPKVSEEIDGMLPIVERLVELEHAYVRNGYVYYDVSTEPDYGAMARLDGYQELLATANERGNNPNDPNKNDPLDFILWQPSKPDEPAWESPWGPGRPGWHIECTTMATRYLGQQIDIHGGGRDLIFPHHPSEIVQTEPYTGRRPFVRFWVHGGLAWLDGEKMSKSLGNLIFIKDALKEHHADTLRWYLLSFPYREDFHYSREDVTNTTVKVERLRAALRAEGGRGDALDLTRERGHIVELMDDNLQFHIALGVLDNMARKILDAAVSERRVTTAQAQLREMAGMLGFLAADDPE
jgi:L-cysteine:1D-myo-inositol 2-amino-2-deoxy-alpha-D-glucopyranoside ligase